MAFLLALTLARDSPAGPIPVAQVAALGAPSAGASSGVSGVATDWVSVGLILAIAGGFLLANAILFRHPRTLVEEHFGRRRERLGTIRDYIFHRVQVHLGFFFLLLGFAAQLFGRFKGPPVPAAQREFPMSWVGGVLLAVVALEVSGWLLSQWLFRRYVRAYFLRNPPDLEADVGLARELGDLYGIRSWADDTVPSYLVRLRRRIGLPTSERVPEARPAERLFDAEEAEPDEGFV